MECWLLKGGSSNYEAEHLNPRKSDMMHENFQKSMIWVGQNILGNGRMKAWT